MLRIALSNTMVVISGLDSKNCDSGSQASSYPSATEQENRGSRAPVFRTEMDFRITSVLGIRWLDPKIRTNAESAAAHAAMYTLYGRSPPTEGPMRCRG